MYIFLISVLVMTIGGLIVFKKEFWENRYIVLLGIVGLSFIGILVTNYSVRKNLDTNITTKWEKSIQPMVLNNVCLDITDSVIISSTNLKYQYYICEDSLVADSSTFNVIDSVRVVVDKKLYLSDVSKETRADNTYDFIANTYNLDSILIAESDTIIYKKDTIKRSIYVSSHYLIYNHNGHTSVAFREKESGDVDEYKLKNIVIQPCENDSLCSITKISKVYTPTSWVSGISLPKIGTYYTLYIPQKEYDLIPKRYLNEVSF